MEIEMKIDLHIHAKTGSDGNLSIEEVFQEAKKRNINLMSITDHDSIDCQERAIALAKRLGLVVISSDVTRKKLAGIPTTEHRFEEFDAGIYPAEFSGKTYDKMLSEAKEFLVEGGSVIIDASFIKAEERLKAKRLAEEVGADFFIVECTLDEESVKQRLAQRLEQASVSDGRWEIYEPQRRRFDPVIAVPETNHVIIDTSPPVGETVRQVLDKFNKE